MSSDPNLDTCINATFQPTQRVKKTGAGHCRVAKAFHRKRKPTGEPGGPVSSRKINGSGEAGIK